MAHAQHMYGNDLQKVNRNAEAVAEFRKAEQIEETYYREEHVETRYDWHHIHNLDLMSISHAFMGQMKDAEALWREAFATPAVSGLWEAYQAKWPEFLIERGRADEALRAAQKLLQHSGQWVAPWVTFWRDGHMYTSTSLRRPMWNWQLQKKKPQASKR